MPVPSVSKPGEPGIFLGGARKAGYAPISRGNMVKYTLHEGSSNWRLTWGYVSNRGALPTFHRLVEVAEPANMAYRHLADDAVVVDGTDAASIIEFLNAKDTTQEIRRREYDEGPMMFSVPRPPSKYEW